MKKIEIKKSSSRSKLGSLKLYTEKNDCIEIKISRGSEDVIIKTLMELFKKK